MDIDFGFNSAWVTIGFGANPLQRSVYEAAGIRFGSLVRVTGINQWSYVTEISDYEISSNPDAGVIDSNPFGLRVLSDRVVVADAGANALLQIGQFGQVTTLAVFPRRTVGPVTIDEVPTSVAVGPDGAYIRGTVDRRAFPGWRGCASSVCRRTAGRQLWLPAVSPTSSTSPSILRETRHTSSNTTLMASFRRSDLVSTAD